MVATEMEGGVGQWVKPGLMERVDRKCQMMLKGRCEWGDAEASAWPRQAEEGVEVEVEEAGLRGVQGGSEQGGVEAQAVPQLPEPGDGEGEEVNQRGQVHREGPAGPRSHARLPSGEEEEEEGDKELPAGGPEEEEHKEEQLPGPSTAGPEHTQQRLLSPVGWHSDSSSVRVEPPTPGRSVSSDLLERPERYGSRRPAAPSGGLQGAEALRSAPCSQENSSHSITSSSRGDSGSGPRPSALDGSSDLSSHRKEKGALISEKRAQVMLGS